MKNKCKVPLVRLFGNLNQARSAKVPLLIAAIVAVIGFSMAACDDPNPPGPEDVYTEEFKEATTAGRLTITGLSAYNGKKINAQGSVRDDDEDTTLLLRLDACQTAYDLYQYTNGNLDRIVSDKTVPATITGDQVTLKVFCLSLVSAESWKSYTGNDQNVSVNIVVFDENDVTWYVPAANIKVDFTNGIGTGAFVPGP
jgi:hypothetical protein